MAGRPPGARRRGSIAIAVAAGAVLVGLTAAVPALAGPTPWRGEPSTEAGADAAPRADGPIVLAYYYIWYEPRSWDRAKTDLPRLGPYSSKDPAVIAQHVAWAKAAGIDALIVSWKREPRLDAPLATLVEAARDADLGLVLLYQGLDFSRRPLDSRRIADDLEWFMSEYGKDPVFEVFGTPTIIFSGTPSFSLEQIAAVRQAVVGAGPARLLGSEHSGEDYAARRDVLDGDAYYWSSVDPVRDRGYRDRLERLAVSVREDGGLWVAPVAPGFDARLIGGTRVVDRADGATYRTQWTTALSTDPDGLGIISWNEFSENSHIEPSQNYDATYLTATAALGRETLGRQTPIDPAAATARPIEASPSVAPQVSAAGRNTVVEQLLPIVVAVLLLVSLAALARRPRASTPPTSAAP